MESGWWPIESADEIEAFDATRNAALERGVRERERYEFLAAAGRESRTPLTSIRGYIAGSERTTRAGVTERIDTDSCMHAVINVIENAIKYSGHGGIVDIWQSSPPPTAPQRNVATGWCSRA